MGKPGLTTANATRSVRISGAKIGFAPKDRFMVTRDNELVVIRRDSLVFGADTTGTKTQHQQ